MGWGIGEGCDAVLFQSHAFYFHKSLCAVQPESKIKTGIVKADFPSDIFYQGTWRKMGKKAAAKDPFPGRSIGSLGVHVDKEFFPAETGGFLIDADQIPCSPAPFFQGLRVMLQDYRSSGKKKFPAAAGIFNVADFFMAVNKHIGDETVGAVLEDAAAGVQILHIGSPFRLFVVPLQRLRHDGAGFGK